MTAEFMKHRHVPCEIPDSERDDGFAAFGKVVPYSRRQRAYEHAKQMGCDNEASFAVVDGMSEQIRRDQPYEAMEVGMKYLDLTGTYRLLAVLCTDPAGPPEVQHT